MYMYTCICMTEMAQGDSHLTCFLVEMSFTRGWTNDSGARAGVCVDLVRISYV